MFIVVTPVDFCYYSVLLESINIIAYFFESSTEK